MQVSALGAAAARNVPSAIPQAFEAMQVARNRHDAGAVSRITARFGRGDDALARVASVREDLLDRWHGLDKTIVDADGRPGQGRSAEGARLREELAGVDRQIEQQDLLIERRVPGFRDYLNPATVALSTAQSLLGADEALLSYLVDENASYLIVVRRDRYSMHTLDIGRSELVSIIKRLREQLDYPSGDDAGRTVFRAYPVAQANQLYRRLFTAAEPSLQGAAHLMIVSDDALHGLPFAALVTEPFAGVIRDPEEHAKVAWLGRRYALSMLPAEGVLNTLRRSARKPPASRAFAGFGDPLLGGEERGVRSGGGSRAYSRDALANVNQIWSFAPLPETRYALYAMADILNADQDAVRLQAEASEASVKRLDLSDYRVIAFATYGFMADDFKGLAESALVFSPPQRGTEMDDGLLTASEVAQLKLNADLVILTASSTAASDGTPDAEGISGLARAFFHAGDRALLATHWAVPSDATLKLVTRTLRERARGAGNAEALRRAMLPLMNGEDRLAFAHPSYWAPFMVVGEGNVPGVTALSPAAPTVVREQAPAQAPAEPSSGGGGFGKLFQGIFGGGSGSK
jgi:CHAT domain-containing protein